MMMEELIKQSEEGNTEAQFQLGLAYYNGNGIEESHEKAFEWWLKAAEEEVSAMRNLGIMYRDGDGVEQDLFNAMYWFGKASRYGMKEAKNDMNAIRLWIVKECGDTTTEDTSELYAIHINRFIKGKGEKIDRFIADCKERKKYKPSTYTDIDLGNEGLVVYLDNNYPRPTSVRQKGFKEYLLSELFLDKAVHLWEWNNKEWAFANLDAMVEVIKDLSEPWIPHIWMSYYANKARFYMKEQKWGKAETAYRDMLGYHYICNMSQFSMDDENIYEGISQNEVDDFCASEWACYDGYVSLIECLIQQNNMEEAQDVFAEFYSILENRIKRDDSYVIDDWILNEWKNENNQEERANLIRILKHFGLSYVWAFCILYCGKLEKEMNENGVGNGYQWSREQYECVEQMFSFASSYLEQYPKNNDQRDIYTFLVIYKGVYLMQTRRFILAEKHFLQGLEMVKEKLQEERNVELLAEIIGSFDDLYQVQNIKAEKRDFLLSLLDLFTEDEIKTECYIALCKKLNDE